MFVELIPHVDVGIGLPAADAPRALVVRTGTAPEGRLVLRQFTIGDVVYGGLERDLVVFAKLEPTRVPPRQTVHLVVHNCSDTVLGVEVTLAHDLRATPLVDADTPRS